MKHISGTNREQIQMISLEQMVEKNAMVRIIDAFVGNIEIQSFGFNYFSLNKEGRPPFHPSTMMKIYLYGYQNSIRSCRKLEKACKTNIEMMWLVHEQKPHYKTIANFRKDNAQSFKAVFRYFVSLLKEWKLIKGKTIAIDSFKIRVQNSLKNNFNQRKIKRHLSYIDNKIEEYEKALDIEDSVEVKKKLDYNQSKKRNYEQLSEQLKKSGDGQLSTTDPEAKAVLFQRNSVKVGYNIQAASDGKYKLLIAADTADVNDTKALASMVEKVQQNIGQPTPENEMDVLADKGYHSGREIKACEKLNVNTYISPKASSSTKTNPAYAMEAFNYNEQEDTYTCPANQKMYTNGRWYNKKLDKSGRKSYHVKHYKTKACKNCTLRNECTKNKNGRVIERTEFAQYVKENNDRVNQNPEYYRVRQQIIDHQFGTIKRHWHFDYCLTRGKEKVLGETYLIFTVYNLKRLMSIFRFEEIMASLKAIKDAFMFILIHSALIDRLSPSYNMKTHQSSHQLFY
jgi:transposase